MAEVNVIGAGLAGSEAALQLAKRGIKVNLYEMRPKKSTGAHKTDKFAEFVCSNSLGAGDCSNASGLLKKEMELLGGELIKIARECAVPAGNALAVDRELFSQTVTKKIEADENINIIKMLKFYFSIFNFLLKVSFLNQNTYNRKEPYL